MNAKLRSLIAVICSTLLLLSCGVSKKLTCEQKGYSIEGVHIGVDGTFLVRVSYTAPDLSQESVNLARKYAVEGILFKGFPARRGEFAEQYPLVREKRIIELNQVFFDEFLSDTGDYSLFINRTVSDAPEITKVNRFYEISMIVSVSKDALRRHLENKGILDRLSDGFRK